MPLSSPIAMPRWEWRSIATSLPELRQRLSGVRIETVREIHETYLLCLKSSHNAKIRNGILDLKWRIQVNTQGLELWNPVLRTDFPMEPVHLSDLFGAWSLPLPVLGRVGYSQEQFLQEIVAPHPELRAVEVQKIREGFLLDGTTCEFAIVAAGGLRLESFCVEHEDPGLVMNVLSDLGLNSRQNTNYPKALKLALAQRVA